MRVTTDGLGNWLATWYSDDSFGGMIGTDFDLLIALSTDNGETWGDPTTLNTDAAIDTWNDRDQKISTDGSGTWIAIWRSDDTLGDSIGSDFDILFSIHDHAELWASGFSLR